MSKITKPDTNNTSPAYWEKVLRSHGLGVDQPLTDHSEGPSANVVVSSTGQTKADDRQVLRGLVDANDSLIFGHEIKKVRTRERTVPDWVLSDERFRKILLTVRKDARGKWARIAYLYHRMNLPDSQVAREMGMTLNATKMVLKRLELASKGLRAANVKRSK